MEAMRNTELYRKHVVQYKDIAALYIISIISQ